MNREFRWNQESFQRISKSSVYNYNHLGERKLRPSCSNICNAWFAHFKWKEQIGKGLCTQWCLTLCNPMDCSPPHSSVHGILPARILEWVVISSSRNLPDPGLKPISLGSPALAGRFFTTSITWEALKRTERLSHLSKTSECSKTIIISSVVQFQLNF